MASVIVAPEQISALVSIGFQGFRRRFRSVTRRAHARYESRDWVSLQRDLLERIDAYGEAIDATVRSLHVAGYSTDERDLWSAARAMFRSEHVTDPYHEIAETYFNSVARQLFGTKGIDPQLEFLAPPSNAPPEDPSRVVRTYVHDGDRRTLLADLLRDCRFHASWVDLTTDLQKGADRLPEGPATVEVVDALFYRGKGAYVVGRFISDEAIVPFALAVRHGRSGLRLGAVLVGERDLAILFSYTRSAFLVTVDEPSSLVAFLGELLPSRKTSEIYSSIGFRKQAKTDGYRELMAYLARSDDRFVRAPGVPGLVMIVFTLPGYDLVFKVIKDRFPPQKKVTPDEVAQRYRIVSRHDRAGRLVEAQRFVDLRLPVGSFEPDLLEELTTDASRTVHIDFDQVTIATVYVERKVTPLDIFVREADVDEARRAIIDYGTAIKNLAASNIFPGDMLLKNFGVTNRGRVVFYDYDEIGLITEHKFRRFPMSNDPFDDMSETPVYGVGPNDVFPEELQRFLGLNADLRQAFNEQHVDLFDTEFWLTVQGRLEAGETIEILPYRRSRSLEAQ
jgi:isocitrate dehydrogenase kinase/phosphatase